uniref:Uncharacterized protein n=1 Tax=Anguilla anguilla TaxID=7936 RepID=A0A0E9WG68_ANGAN
MLIQRSNQKYNQQIFCYVFFGVMLCKKV